MGRGIFLVNKEGKIIKFINERFVIWCGYRDDGVFYVEMGNGENETGYGIIKGDPNEAEWVNEPKE